MTADASPSGNIDQLHDELFQRLDELEAQIDGVLAANGIQVEASVQLAELDD